MSRQGRYRWIVTGVTAAILLGTFGASWVIAGLIGADWERPEPEPQPVPTDPWYGDLFGGGDE